MMTTFMSLFRQSCNTARTSNHIVRLTSHTLSIDKLRENRPHSEQNSHVMSCPAPSVCPSVLSVLLFRPCYHSAAHNILRILVIFSAAIDLSRSMNPVDYGVSVFIFWDPVTLWKFMNALTDLILKLGRWMVPVLWTVFFLLLCLYTTCSFLCILS